MLTSLPLHRLVQSRRNARRTGREIALGELTSSIRSHGLRQNLNVRSITGGRYEVVAGGRRLLALKQLVRDGVLPPDHPVPCLLLADNDNPSEVSLAENAVRQPMHPDDQCDAFDSLVQTGSSIEDVAARFGVAPTIVRQRLKLASVSPVLRALYRKGGLTFDQMTAFAVIDDHDAQEAAWSGLPEWNNGPDAIRRTLTRSAVPVTHRLARFVGTEIYEAYGGPVIRDLFNGPDQSFLADGHLLERLATEQLNRVADQVRREGWSWVTIEPDLDWSTRYGRIHPTSEDDGVEAYAPSDLARSGARLSVNADGTLRVDRGLVRPRPSDDCPKRRRPASRVGAGALPARVVEELSAHRTAALRFELSRRPDLALATVVHALTLDTIYGRAVDVSSCLDIRGFSRPLEQHTHDSEEGLAHHSLADDHATWAARLPDLPADLWAWCLRQDQPLLLELLAFVVSLTVDTVQTRTDHPDDRRLRHTHQLALALDLDMTSWWQPTARGFGGKVAKSILADALSDSDRSDLAVRVRKAGKAEAADIAIPALLQIGWLPDPLRALAVHETSDSSCGANETSSKLNDGVLEPPESYDDTFVTVGDAADKVVAAIA